MQWLIRRAGSHTKSQGPTATAQQSPQSPQSGKHTNVKAIASTQGSDIHTVVFPTQRHNDKYLKELQVKVQHSKTRQTTSITDGRVLNTTDGYFRGQSPRTRPPSNTHREITEAQTTEETHLRDRIVGTHLQTSFRFLSVPKKS